MQTKPEIQKPTYTTKDIELRALEAFESNQELEIIKISLKILQEPSFVFFKNLDLEENDTIFTSLTACFYLQHDCSYLAQLLNKDLKNDVDAPYPRGVAFKLLSAKAEYDFLSDIGLNYFRAKYGSLHGYELTMCELGLTLIHNKETSYPNLHNLFAIAALIEISQYIHKVTSHIETNEGRYKADVLLKFQKHITSAQRLIQNAFCSAHQNHITRLQVHVDDHIETIKSPAMNGSFRPPHKFDIFYNFCTKAASKIWRYEQKQNMLHTYPSNLARYLEKKFQQHVKETDQHHPEKLPDLAMLDVPKKEQTITDKLWEVIGSEGYSIKKEAGHKQSKVFSELDKIYNLAKVSHPFLETVE